MANWPTSFDTVLGLTAPATLAGPPTHEAIHEQNAEILAALETELGLNPSGSDSTVAALLARLTPATHSIATSESTSSTSYTDLATVGPTVTMTTGTLVLVTFAATFDVTANVGGMGIDVSGATTIAAPAGMSTAGRTIVADMNTASGTDGTSGLTVLIPVTAGSNTFRAKYKVTSGGGSVAFSARHLIVQRMN